MLISSNKHHFRCVPCRGTASFACSSCCCCCCCCVLLLLLLPSDHSTIGPNKDKGTRWNAAARSKFSCHGAPQRRPLCTSDSLLHSCVHPTLAHHITLEQKEKHTKQFGSPCPTSATIHHTILLPYRSATRTCPVFAVPTLHAAAKMRMGPILSENMKI